MESLPTDVLFLVADMLHADNPADLSALALVSDRLRQVVQESHVRRGPLIVQTTRRSLASAHAFVLNRPGLRELIKEVKILPAYPDYVYEDDHDLQEWRDWARPDGGPSLAPLTEIMELCHKLETLTFELPPSGRQPGEDTDDGDRLRSRLASRHAVAVTRANLAPSLATLRLTVPGHFRYDAGAGLVAGYDVAALLGIATLRTIETLGVVVEGWLLAQARNMGGPLANSGVETMRLEGEYRLGAQVAELIAEPKSPGLRELRIRLDNPGSWGPRGPLELDGLAVAIRTTGATLQVLELDMGRWYDFPLKKRAWAMQTFMPSLVALQYLKVEMKILFGTPQAMASWAKAPLSQAAILPPSLRRLTLVEMWNDQYHPCMGVDLSDQTAIDDALAVYQDRVRKMVGAVRHMCREPWRLQLELHIDPNLWEWKAPEGDEFASVTFTMLPLRWDNSIRW